MKQEDTSDDIVFSLAIPLRTLGAGEQFRVLASLGTGLHRPGDNIYVGGGVLMFDYLIVSGGIVVGDATYGGDRIVEEVFGAAGPRELFSTISTRREWKPYVGVSVKVY